MILDKLQVSQAEIEEFKARRVSIPVDPVQETAANASFEACGIICQLCFDSKLTDEEVYRLRTWAFKIALKVTAPLASQHFWLGAESAAIKEIIKQFTAETRR